jgi:hypothetical protein
MMVYFMDTWSTLRYFVIFYGQIWCSLWYFSRFGILYQEKSGNPAWNVFELPGGAKEFLQPQVEKKSVLYKCRRSAFLTTSSPIGAKTFPKKNIRRSHNI